MDARTAEELLRRFEPVIRFTKGEWFYPMDCEPYVDACSLWVARPGEDAVCVVPAGELTLERLAQQPDDTTGAVHYLKIPNPKEGRTGVAGWRGARTRTPIGRRRFSGPAGAARARRLHLAVGGRALLPDALGQGEGARRGRGGGTRPVRPFHGGETTLDVTVTWFARTVGSSCGTGCSTFNDWRSNVFGANDHEADWEKIFIYLSESESGEVRQWVAYAAHEETGDDLRRRWDDPELEKVGEHPVAYVCAGSHATRYFRGEYLTELAFPLPRASPRYAGSRVASVT